MGRPEYILVNSEKPRDAAMRHGTGFVALLHHNLFIIAFTNLMVNKVFHGVKAVRCYCAYRVLCKCFRSRDVLDKTMYMRWEQDNDLQVLGPLGLFQEYLSMGQ